MSIKDLFKARLRIRMLEDEVENPMNVHRWRALEVRSRDRNSYHYCFQLLTESSVCCWHL